MYHFSLPIVTKTESNTGGHWRGKWARGAKQRQVAFLMCSAILPKTFPSDAIFTIRLTRISPRCLDSHDNLMSALKHVADGIADAIGIDDGSPRYSWVYAQRKGKPKENAVEILVIIDLERGHVKSSTSTAT